MTQPAPSGVPVSGLHPLLEGMALSIWDEGAEHVTLF